GVVADDDGYELGALRYEASGGRVGAVANAPGHLLHPFARLRAHVSALVEHPGNRRNRHACAVGDVAARGAPAHCFLTRSYCLAQRAGSSLAPTLVPSVRA